MKKVTVDYILKTSASLLFKRLSTASGLSEWFSEDVTVKNGIFNFKWNNNIQSAKVVVDKKALTVKFVWLDVDKDFLEFRIEQSSISKELSLFITDFVEDDEDVDDAFELWDNLIGRLKTKLGLK